MTEPNDHGPFEVRIEPLAGSRGSAARARIVAVLGVAFVSGAIGLAVMSREAGRQLGGPTSTRSDAAATLAASQRPAIEPSLAGAGRVERLLAVDDVALRGAPFVDLLVRAGDDLRIERWESGRGRDLLRTVPDVFAGWTEASAVPVLSPDGAHVLALHRAEVSDDDEARLVAADGAIVWQSDDVESHSKAIWAADGRAVVVAAQSMAWHVVSIGRDGDAMARRVSLAAGQLGPTGSELRPLPLGFSADARWIYGDFVTPEPRTMSRPFRVAVDGSVIQFNTTLGVGRPDGLTPDPDTIDQRLIDPFTGRVAQVRPSTDPSRRLAIEVRNPDNGLAFIVDDDNPVGLLWADAGDLFVLSTDSIPMFNRSALTRIGPDGVAGLPVLELGPTAGSGLLGYRDGHIALVVTVSQPEVALQLVLVDIADPGRISAIPVPADLMVTAIVLRSSIAFDPPGPAVKREPSDP